jgi:hypothetical protein
VTPVTDPSPSPIQTALTAETQALAAMEPPPPPDTSNVVPAAPEATSQAPTQLPVGTEALTGLLSGVPTTSRSTPTGRGRAVHARAHLAHR